MERFVAKNESENNKIAKLVLNQLEKSNINLLLLKGDLGAGKTTITREITKLLSAAQLATSPTFVIQKIYPLRENNSNFNKIIHIDLYRLSGKEEILELGIEEDLKDRTSLIIVEWPERYSFDNYKNLTVEIIEKGNGREFMINSKPAYSK